MTELRDWSVTASANTGTAANGFFAENMAYSEVNNAAREMQAIIARDRKDKNGTLIAGGSTSSYVLSPSVSIASYRDGDYYRFAANVKNAGATTLQVSSLSARPVVKTDLTALAAGDIVAGGVYEVFYRSASANFQAVNVPAIRYPQNAAEVTASVTPTNYRYEPGNVLRYGAVGDGITDDSTAFNAASAVIGTYNIVVPPGSYMMTSQWLVTAPSYNRSSIFAYGAEILTTGAISALAITGGSTTGGLTVLGLQVNHRGNADATCGFDLYGAWNTRLQDCSVECDDTGAGYAGYRLRNTTAADTSTGTFWTLIDHCQIRLRAGGDGTYPEIGILIRGASNATTIRDCNLSTTVTTIHHTHESGQDYMANGLLVTNCAFEGYTTAYHWDGSGAGGTAPGGVRFIGNRFEDGTTMFSFTGAGSTVPTSPPFLFGNYRISNAGTYLNNPDALAINRFDPSETPDGAMAIYNDSPFLYRNSGTASQDHAALFQSVTGKGISIQAVVDGPEPGTDVASLTLRSGGGAILAGASAASLYQTGVASISRGTTEAKNLRGTVTLSGGTANVTFGTAESDATYFIVTGCSAAESIAVTSKATTGFTVTSSNASSTAVVDWVLIR